MSRTRQEWSQFDLNQLLVDTFFSNQIGEKIITYFYHPYSYSSSSTWIGLINWQPALPPVWGEEQLSADADLLLSPSYLSKLGYQLIQFRFHYTPWDFLRRKKAFVYFQPYVVICPDDSEPNFHGYQRFRYLPMKTDENNYRSASCLVYHEIMKSYRYFYGFWTYYKHDLSNSRFNSYDDYINYYCQPEHNSWVSIFRLSFHEFCPDENNPINWNGHNLGSRTRSLFPKSFRPELGEIIHDDQWSYHSEDD